MARAAGGLQNKTENGREKKRGARTSNSWGKQELAGAKARHGRWKNAIQHKAKDEQQENGQEKKRLLPFIHHDIIVKKQPYFFPLTIKCLLANFALNQTWPASLFTLYADKISSRTFPESFARTPTVAPGMRSA